MHTRRGFVGIGRKLLPAIVMLAGVYGAITITPGKAGTGIGAGIGAGKLDGQLHAFRTANSIPGISVAIIHDEHIAYASVGFANIEHKVPVGRQTVFPLASLSKPVSSAALLKAVESGRLDLDEPLSRWLTLPSRAEALGSITLRQVLSQQSGLSHWRHQDLIEPARHLSAHEAARRALARPLRCEPGDCFHYSTPAWNLAALAVAQTGEKDFIAFVSQVLDEEFRSADPYSILANRAQGYQQHPNGHLMNAPPLDISERIPGGGIAASAHTLATFMRGLMRGDVLSGESRRLLWQEQQLANGDPTGYALGWRVTEFQGRRLVHHSGSQRGYSSHVSLLPDQRRGVVILANRGNVDLWEFAASLLESNGG